MKVVVLGAGGHAKVLIDIINQQKDWEIDKIELLDDKVEKGTRIAGCEVKGELEKAKKYDKSTKFIIGIGMNKVRRRLAESFCLNYLTLIHPSAIIGSNVKIGRGTVVMPGAIINSGTEIGEHCIINTGAIVEHDNLIQDYVHISPGACLGGAVEIGRECWIGIGSVIKNNITICSETVVGAGGVVIGDIKIEGTYAGCPAKRIY